eukprot:CAMPEP_0174313606 /NCGR_PEP_ID=MMETSP0810-20121108/5095_1 /TAXON_ID=73025 ORGANISM="Eutreptiella gymnastica-like, Strain CCMP1594" /NCGR_SAMPLE_ID=MMETSP0810 /ASSEMBLY_ACC=CAM_ASM_000659 /LENGTH=32 /DNA_ID= /DNA_START= /DNA_END= /DNA_ORIENTATION=
MSDGVGDGVIQRDVAGDGVQQCGQGRAVEGDA